jgi:urease accessory protein
LNAPAIPGAFAGWRAELSLAYGRDGARTIPLLRRHIGPLRIQKGLTPEGPELWHQIVVHPPGGVAGGDQLAIDVTVQADAKALLTTPGANKWYRSVSGAARQTIQLRVAANASLEWLPMENILFDGARAQLECDIRLDATASLIAFELTCLGRPASQDWFVSGELRSRIKIRRADRLLFSERTVLDGVAAGSCAQSARAGLAGQPMFGTFFAVSCAINDELLRAARDLPVQGDWALTRIGELLIARWRGAHSDQGLRAFRALWALLRPPLLARSPCWPRIWNT